MQQPTTFTTSQTTTVSPAADERVDKPKPTNAEEAYKRWWLDRTPDNLHTAVKALEPTISFKLMSMGVADNPQMKHQARLFAADAIKKFDPLTGASLHTWTQNQLQNMHRFKRENQGPVKIPDRAAIDAWTLEKATREHIDEHGQEPDVLQLADRTGMSVKRIATVRKTTRPVAATSQMHDEGGAEMVDYLGESLEYVYGDADYLDRRIIEMTTGYGGTPILPKNAIAAKLGISPSQVTRRSDRIGAKVHETERSIQQAYA